MPRYWVFLMFRTGLFCFTMIGPCNQYSNDMPFDTEVLWLVKY